jgi:threonine dehydrogenase-like Zn-dependent dehydrogenase
VDLRPRRRELARRVGADIAIDPDGEDLVGRVRECTGGPGAGCVIEAVGNPAVLQSCMKVCAPGARVVVMGAIVGRAELDLYSEFVFRELTLVASQQPRNPVQDSIYYHFTGQRNRQTMLDLIRRGAVNVRDLLTHRTPYTQAPELYRRLGEARRADRLRAAEPGRRPGDGADMIGVLLEWEGEA